MSAPRHRFALSQKRVWQLLFCLALLAYVCRAIIPAGYMPASAADSGGRFAITFCTAGSQSNTIWIDLIGQPDQPDSGEHLNQQNCPFGVVAAQALLPVPPAPTLIGVLSHRPVLLWLFKQPRSPLPAQGPPLGSRAPPAYLA